MGGVVKTITKPFKEVGEEIFDTTKRVANEILEVPSEVINVVTPPVAQTVESVTRTAGSVVRPITQFASSPEGAATLGIAGTAFGVPGIGAATSFLNRKQSEPVTTSQVKSLSPEITNRTPTQAVPQIQTTNDFTNLLLPISGGILLLVLLTRRK